MAAKTITLVIEEEDVKFLIGILDEDAELKETYVDENDEEGNDLVDSERRAATLYRSIVEALRQ